MPPLVLDTRMLSQHQQEICDRQDFLTEPNSCFNDLLDSLNSLSEFTEFTFDLGKTPIFTTFPDASLLTLQKQ